MLQAIASPARHRRPTVELLILAAPMIGMTMSRMLLGFIDFTMVSQLGTAAQAAISPCTILLFVIACVGMGMAQGVQTFVSQAEGRGEPERAGAYLWQTIYVALFAAILSAPIAYLTPVWFVYIGALGHHPTDVQLMEISFLSYALWSIGPMTATAGLESFYNGIKRPVMGLIAMLVSVAVITVGNWLLIFGNLGFPKLGIAGSGIATFLAWFSRLAVLIVPLVFSRAINHKYHIWNNLRLQLDKLTELIRVGGPISFQWVVDIGAWFVFLEFMMPPFGETAMAGGNLAIQFMHLSFMPALGIGLALTTQVGNAIGAGRPEEAVMRVIVARRLIVGFMGAMTFLFVAAGEPLASLLCFETNPELRASVIAAAQAMLIWVGLFQLSDALCITYSFASRGAGDTRVPALLFAICCWVIFVGGGFAMTWLLPQWSYHGPWAMCTLYIVVLGYLLWRRFHSEKWRDIRLFDKEKAFPVVVEPSVEAESEPAAAVHV